MPILPTSNFLPMRLLRRALGFFFLGLGILGAILPIIPGWPGFFVAVVLLGRRDPTLRHMHLLVRRGLRRLRTAREPSVRRFGRWLSGQYVDMRRSLTPHLIRAEQIFG